MTSRTFFRTAILGMALSAMLPPLKAKDLPLTEKAKIEGLLTHLESLKAATFIRNGSHYDAQTAAQFLRGKWHAHEGEIKTADDFIAHAATVSSTTGKPYLIQLSGASPIRSADYLAAQLRKLKGHSGSE